MLVAGLVTAVLGGALTGAPLAAADAGPVMTVRGSAGGTLPGQFGPMAGDPVRFTVDATAPFTDPLRPRGTFQVSHHKPDGSLLARFSGEVTSLHAVGQVGILTGTVTWAEHPGAPQVEFVGKPVSLTVQDEGVRGDRIGWVWGFFGEPVSRLQGTAPVLRLSDGGFTVRGPVAPRAAGQVATGRVAGKSAAGPAAGELAAGQAAAGPSAAEVRADAAGQVLAGHVTGTSEDPEFQGDPLSFTVAARTAPGAAPGTATGEFHVVHEKAGGGLVADFRGELTCLVVAGRIGFATGVVRASADPSHVGLEVSFSVYDGARGDRLGWLWGLPGSEPVNDCQGFTPFFTPERGGFFTRGM